MKVLKFFGGIVIGVLCIGLLCGAAYLGDNIKIWNPLNQDAIVSGIHLGSLNRDELLRITNNPAEVSITIHGKYGTDDQIIGGDIVANPLENDAFIQTVKNKAFSIPNDLYASSSFAQKRIPDEPIHMNQMGVSDTVANLTNVTAVELVKTTNAHGTYNKSSGKFIPVSESIGTEVDTQRLGYRLEDVLNTIQNGTQQTIDLAAENLYTNPTITMGSPQLQANIDKLNSTLDSVITYKYGWNTINLTGSTYGNWLSADDNGNITVDKNQFRSYLDQLKENKNFFYSKEEAAQNKKSMSCYLINPDNEIEIASQAILNDQSIERELEYCYITIDDIAPIYTAENQPKLDQLLTELGPEFVYINIDQQFMWYYKDGNLVCATPVTTGTRYSHDTPKGLYTLDYKNTNVTLKGRNADGSEYQSPVVYWMPFNGGVGIHDADNWRSSYGANVYVYNGSHGCVNTPRDKCKIIYDNISINCPILVE